MGIVATAPGTRIWLDYYNISGFMNAGNSNVEQTTLDARTFSDAGPRHVETQYTHAHEYATFFDPSESPIGSDEILHTLIDDDLHYLGEAFGAGTIGSNVHESVVKLARKPHSVANGQLQMIQLGLAGAGSISSGRVLASATATATVNYTGQNQGVTTALQTYQAVFRVLSGTFSNIIFQIQESSDDGADAYALITGLTATLTAVGVTRVTFTGATETFKRAAITTWSGTSAVVVVTGGIVVP